jgi:hypothetical protein
METRLEEYIFRVQIKRAALAVPLNIYFKIPLHSKENKCIMENIYDVSSIFKFDE